MNEISRPGSTPGREFFFLVLFIIPPHHIGRPLFQAAARLHHSKVLLLGVLEVRDIVGGRFGALRRPG